MKKRRIACCRIPKLPIALLSRGAAREGEERPLALLEGSGTRAVVRVVSEAAAKDGVRPGMSLAVARARSPALVALPDDPDLRREEQRKIAASLLAVAPRVSLFGSDGFLCDASAMDRLGGETALATALFDTCTSLGHPGARVGVADTAVAARAATMLARVRVRHVPPGGDRALLAPLPLSVLGAPAEIEEALCVLGVFTCGDLVALDPGSLEARFGPDGSKLHRLARGIDGRGPPPPSDDDRSSAHLDLGGPVAGTGGLAFVWKPLAERVLAGTRGRWIASLRLTLSLDDRKDVVRTLEAAAPTGRADVLVSLVTGALEKETLSSPVVAVTLEAERTTPPEPIQTGLFEGDRDTGARDAALSRLVGRYGKEAVVEPVPEDDARPERRGKFVKAGHGHGRGHGHGKTKEPTMGLRLAAEPTPVEVRESEKGPVAIFWNGRWRRVVKRPWVESLRGRWWAEPDRERLDHRVVLDDGLLVWLTEDPKEKSWSLMGWYD